MAEAVSTGSGTTGSTKEQAQEKAQEVAGQAQEKMGQAADQAKSTVRQQVDTRSTQLGEQVNTQASDVRTVAQQLREQGKEGPAKVAEQAADRAEKVGNYLSQSDGERILHDVEDFGRRRPWAIALGGLALGFAASRVLKASSSERYRSTQDSSSPYYRGSYGGRYGGTYGGRPPAVSPDPATTRLPAGTGVGGPGNGVGAL